MHQLIHPKLVIVLLRKEWAELYRNTMLLGTVLFMPLLFAVIPIIMLWSVGDIGGDIGESMSYFSGSMQGLCGGLSGGDCGMAVFMAQFNMMFMFIPIMLPATIIPYAIVGEKTQHSLEPLLAV